MDTDVAVIGGGPAGIATAIAATLHGLRVVVIDHRTPPIDKACGEGLLPEAVNALRTLGIELNSTIGFPFSGFQFSDDRCCASGRIPSGCGFGVRRITLHRLLTQRASDVGVRLLWGSRISRIDDNCVFVGQDAVSYRWLVGADGQHSNVRRFARLESHGWYRSRFGFRCHYAVEPWTDMVQVYWGRKFQLVAAPVARNEICISAFTSDSKKRLHDLIPEVSDLAKRLAGLSSSSVVAGAITAFGRARSVAQRNIALVGDAACSIDGIAGQGLSLALQQAAALGPALARGDLTQYRRAYRRIVHGPMRMARLMLAMNASVMLRRRVLRLFEAKPAAFARLVSMHTGLSLQRSPKPSELLGLAWNVLRA